MPLFPSPSIHSPHLWANMKVGLLGGSFNPAHEGHKHISLLALKMLKLDAVWWLVSPQNPLKSAKGMAPIKDRLDSARNVSRHPRIIPTDIETMMGTRYTVDTLSTLKHRFGNTRFVWLMGSDNLHQFHLWNDWQKIFQTVPVAVFDRPPEGNSLPATPAGLKFQRYRIDESNAGALALCEPPCWTVLHTVLNPLSSTAIRAGNKS